MAGRHRTIDRVVAILELAAAAGDDGVTLASLPEQLGAPKSSLHGLVSGLVATGYLLERDRRYLLGPAPRLLFERPTGSPLLKPLREELVRLRKETGETALIGVRAGYEVIYTDQLESAHHLRYAAPLFQRRPLLTTSTGKVFLASLSDRQVQRLHQQLAPGAEVPLEELLDELAEVRRQGYSDNRGHTVEGITGLATGVRDRQGSLLAALAVNGPSERMDRDRERCASALLEAGRRASRALAMEPIRR